MILFTSLVIGQSDYFGSRFRFWDVKIKSVLLGVVNASFFSLQNEFRLRDAVELIEPFL